MTVEEISSVVCLFVLTVGLLVLLFLAVFLTYKSEKEYKELRNNELKARIKLINYYNEVHKDK